eukprot:12417745-Karenia_brevis.AAC.1
MENQRNGQVGIFVRRAVEFAGGRNRGAHHWDDSGGIHPGGGPNQDENADIRMIHPFIPMAKNGV